MNKRLLILICFVSSSYNIIAQIDTTFVTHDSNYEDDTLIYITDTLITYTVMDRQPVLYGTVVLPETANTMSARVFGLYLTNVSKSACRRLRNETEAYRVDDEVFKIMKTDSIWYCELKINANCCHEFLCEISVENNNTLNFIYQGYGNAYCACSCNYLLSYEIELEDYANMNEAISKIKYTMLNSNEKTIKELK